MRADGVEISQQRNRPLVVRNANVLEYLLYHDFGVAVWVGRGVCRHSFNVGHGVVHAVNRRRGGENYLLAAVFAHRLYQHQRACDVVVVVLHGLLHRFADSFQTREMYNCVDLVFLENLIERFQIENVELVEFKIFSCNFLYSFERLGLRVREIVHYYYAVACLEQLYAGVASDESCAASYQNICHNKPSFLDPCVLFRRVGRS